MRAPLIALVLFLFSFVASPTGAQTIIPGGLTRLPDQTWTDWLVNGDFEGNSAAPWKTASGTPTDWVVDSSTAYRGSRSLRWSVGKGNAIQTFELPPGVYRLTAWIKTSNVGPEFAGMRLLIDLRDGGFNVFPSEPTGRPLWGTLDWTPLEVRVVVPQPLPGKSTVTTQVVLNNYNATSGQAWFDDVKFQRLDPLPVDAFMLYPNYRGMLFDDQPSVMRFAVTVTPPAGDFTQYSGLRVLLFRDDGSGHGIAVDGAPPDTNICSQTSCQGGSASWEVAVDGSHIQPGAPHYVRFVLLKNGVPSPYSYPDYLVSRVRRVDREASMRTWVDKDNRIYVRKRDPNNPLQTKLTPEFIRGIYDAGLPWFSGAANWDQFLFSPTGDRRLGGINFNMYLNVQTGRYAIPHVNGLMDDLQGKLTPPVDRDIKFLQTGNCLWSSPEGDPFFQLNAPDPNGGVPGQTYVQSFRTHLAAAGYYTVDECRSWVVPDVFNQYDRLASLDPDGLAVATLWDLDLGTLFLWRDNADVFGTDPYPLSYGTPPPHGQVALSTIAMREAVKGARPLTPVLQFHKFFSSRFPTKDEMRAHAYMAIVEGANGLWWWTIGDMEGGLRNIYGDSWPTERNDLMLQLRSVINEVADLEPALLALDAAPGTLGISSSICSPSCTPITNPIKTKVKIVNGQGYVFAYNSLGWGTQAITTTFTWPNAPGTVTVKGENRTLTPSGNAFLDTFQPFQAHVYLIPNGGSPGPLQLSFITPDEGATVSRTTMVNLSATGGSGTGYVFTLNDGVNPNIVGTPPLPWDSTLVPNGPRTLTATVRDSLGATNTKTRTVIVANSSVTASIRAPLADATVSGTVMIDMAASGTTGNSNTFELFVDGALTATLNTPGASVPYSWDTIATAVPNGRRTLRLKVTDINLNWGETTISVVVANSPLTVTITSPSEGATVSGSVVITARADNFSGSNNAFDFSVDGQHQTTNTTSTATTSFTWDTTPIGVKAGPHELSVAVRDTAGRTATAKVNVSVSKTSCITPAITSPSQGQTVGAIVTVNMSVACAASGQNRFELFVDTTRIADLTVSSPTTSYAWNTGPTTQGSHKLSLVVTDSTGASAAARIDVTVNNPELMAIINSPPNNATVAGTVTVDMAAHGAPDNVNTFTLSLDGAMLSTLPVTGTTASYTWNTTTATVGGHQVTLTVRDHLDRTATTFINVTVTQPLTVVFTGPTQGMTVSGKLSIDVWAENTIGANNIFTTKVDSNVIDVQTRADRHANIWPWDTTLLSDGSHTLTATVTDDTGRTGTGTITVTVANGLVATITSPAPGSTVVGTVSVNTSVSGSSGSPNIFTLAVDGAPLPSQSVSGTATTFSWDTTAVTNGSHALLLTVKDATGRSGRTTISLTVANPLKAVITAPAAGSTVGGTTTVSMLAVNPSGNQNTFALSVDGVPTPTQTVSTNTASYAWDTTPLTAGTTHTLSLTVTDQVGHTATTSINVTVAQPMSVTFTAPPNGATVNGVIPIDIWVENPIGSSNTFTTSVDGRTIDVQTISERHANIWPWDTTKLPDGPHTLSALVRDSTGRTATGTISVTVANGVLTAAITSPTTGTMVSGIVSVNMSAMNGIGLPNKFDLSINGNLVSTQTVNSSTASYSWNTASLAAGSYALSLTVTDGATRTATTTVTVTVAPPLAVYFTGPTQGATVRGSTAVDIWVEQALGSRNTFVTKLDGAVIDTQTTPGSHANFVWNAGAATNGHHTLETTVTDSTGRTATRSIDVTVANAALMAFFTGPTMGQIVSGSIAVDIWVEQALGNSNTFSTKLDGGSTPIDNQTISGTHRNFVWNTTAVADGNHTLTTTVTDSTGRVTTVTVTISVSNNPLPTVITGPTAGSTVSGNVAVDIWVEQSSGNANYFTLAVDGIVILSQTISGVHATFWPWDTTTASNGTHTLTATVTDATGRSGLVSQNVTVSNP